MRSWGGTAKSIFLFSLTFAVYYPALEVRLVADDFCIVDHLSFEDARRFLKESFGSLSVDGSRTKFNGRNEYRPLAGFSFALSNWIWKGDPWGYHLESILLHAVNVILLFEWLGLLLGNGVVAFVSALLFALHPVHHERVVWIAARDCLLSSFFLLLALSTYTLFRQDHRWTNLAAKTRLPVPGLFMTVSLMGFALSLLSYEGAIVFPGFILLLELTIFKASTDSGWAGLKSLTLRVLPFAGILLAYLTFWLVLFRGSVGHYELLPTFSGVLKNYFALLYRLFYGHQYLAGFLYFLVLALGCLAARRRRPVVLFSLSFIVIGYIPFSLIKGFADRFAYVSAIGYSLLMAILLGSVASLARLHVKRVVRYSPTALAVVIVSSLLVYYTIALGKRIADWKMAGEIADCIPKQIKMLYPELPAGSTFVFARIPQMYGSAYVYPLGLGHAIKKYYKGLDLRVFYGSNDIEYILKARNISDDANTYFFEYVRDERCISKIASPFRHLLDARRG